jgi:hypothetical protein
MTFEPPRGSKTFDFSSLDIAESQDTPKIQIQQPSFLTQQLQFKMAQQGLAKDLFADMGRKVADASAREGDDDEKVVDEIESLCMNCHENVWSPKEEVSRLANPHRAQRGCYSPAFPSSARLS